MRLAILISFLVSSLYAQDGFFSSPAAGAAVGVADWQTSLVGYWPMDAIQRGKVQDWSGKGNVGTATNNPVVTNGIVGNAVYLTDYSGFICSTVQAVSCVFWVKASNKGPAVYGGILNPDGVPGLFQTNDKRLSLYNNGDNYGFLLPTNEWVHVGVSLTETNVSFYSNGVFSVSATEHPIASWNVTRIGYRRLGVNQPFIGSLDDVRIYNRALATNEISAIYRWGWGTHHGTPVHP